MSRTRGDAGDKDLVQVGASTRSRAILEELREVGHIGQLMDGYRLAIAVAIAFGRTPRMDTKESRPTMFAASSLDPDGSIRATINETCPDARGRPYRAAEDLAEQGLSIIKDSMQGDELDLTGLLRRVEEANPRPADAA